MADKRLPPGVAQHPSAPKVPGYVLTLPLGRGASSEVWKAWQERTGKEVALKVLHGLGTDERAGLRASVERLIQLDRHPNVVAVLDADLASEPAWVATDLLESGSLKTRIDSGRPASADEAARWLEDTARALAYVHGRGVIHANLKPSNILFDEEGRPRISDFGPAEGDAHGDGAALARAVRAALGGTAPDEDLAAVLDKSEAPDPDDGYQSMAELAADLEARRRRFPVSPLAHRRLYRARKFLRRNGVVAALAATLAGAVVWGVVTVTERNAALSVELAGAYAQRARTALLQGDPAQAAVLFAKSNLLHPTAAARRDAVGVLSQLARPRVTLALGAPVDAVAISPDGARLFGLGHHAAGLFDARSGTKVSLPRGLMDDLRLSSLISASPSVHFSADGTRVLSDSGEGILKLSDAATGALVQDLPGVAGALSARGLVAAAARTDDAERSAKVTLYDAATGRPTGVSIRHGINENAETAGVAFSPDGSRLLTSGGGVVRVWDPATGRQIGKDVPALRPKTPGFVSFRISYGVPRAGFVGQGSHVWVIEHDDVLLLDAAEGKPYSDPLRLEDSVKAFAADGGSIVAGAPDGAVRLWRGSTPIAAPPNAGLRHTGRVNAVAISAFHGLVASAGEDGTVRFWNLNKWGPAGPVLPHGGPVTSLAFSSDGRSLVTGSTDGQIRVWDVPQLADSEALLEASDAFISPRGDRVVTFKHDGDFTLRSVPGADVVAKGLTGIKTNGFEDIRTDAAASRFLLAPRGVDAVWVFDTASGRRIAGPLRHSDTGRKQSEFDSLDADISPDGAMAATVSTDLKLKLWDVDRGVELPGSAPVPAVLGSINFSPDGKRLAIVHFDKVEVWTIPPGPTPVVTMPKGGVSACWTPDGRRLAVSDLNAHQVTVWNTATGEPAGPPVSFSENTHFMTASHDSRRLALGFDDGTVRLVDPESGEIVGPVLRHAKSARAAAFSPDSAVLASGGLDKTVYLWDAATGEPIARPFWNGDVVTSLAFSADGKSLSAAGSWEMRTWDVSWLRSQEGPAEISARAEETARLRIDGLGAPRALPPPGD